MHACAYNSVFLCVNINCSCIYAIIFVRIIIYVCGEALFRLHLTIFIGLRRKVTGQVNRMTCNKLGILSF